MSDNQQQIQDILEAINRGEDITNEDARVLASTLDTLDFAFRVQSTVNKVLTETIPEMASSLTATVLSRAGRTETKVKRAVTKICDDHVYALLDMVGTLANNLVALAEKPEETPAEEQEPAAE